LVGIPHVQDAQPREKTVNLAGKLGRISTIDPFPSELEPAPFDPNVTIFQTAWPKMKNSIGYNWI
jgi:hypothetical protein